MNRRRSRRGFSLIELLIVIAIILIIITMAMPAFIKAHMFAAETAAEAAIRTVHTTQMQYLSQYGKYATSLSELGPSTGRGPGARHQGRLQIHAHSQRSGLRHPCRACELRQQRQPLLLFGPDHAAPRDSHGGTGDGHQSGSAPGLGSIRFT
jgi:prepilin-type N-terminal cleavage/methylation domain-containing protein